eukprot:5460549-Pleurochrysis_carterae.AAC.1
MAAGGLVGEGWAAVWLEVCSVGLTAAAATAEGQAAAERVAVKAGVEVAEEDSAKVVEEMGSAAWQGVE